MVGGWVGGRGRGSASHVRVLGEHKGKGPTLAIGDDVNNI